VVVTTTRPENADSHTLCNAGFATKRVIIAHQCMTLIPKAQAKAVETSRNQVRENAHRPILRRTQVRTGAHQKEMRARETRRERKIAKAKRQTRMPAKVIEETEAEHRTVTMSHHTEVETHLTGLETHLIEERNAQVLANHLPETRISPNRRGVLPTQ
jgi:hypothetical protein